MSDAMKNSSPNVLCPHHLGPAKVPEMSEPIKECEEWQHTGISYRSDVLRQLFINSGGGRGQDCANDRGSRIVVLLPATCNMFTRLNDVVGN